MVEPAHLRRYEALSELGYDLMSALRPETGSRRRRRSVSLWAHARQDCPRVLDEMSIVNSSMKGTHTVRPAVASLSRV